MNDIPIAYPILSQSILDTSLDNEFNDIIYYQDYKFEIKYKLNTSINIILINTFSLKTSNVNITKSNLPLNKLHKLLIQSLNKVINYKIDIDDTNNSIRLSYITDMVEIIENIDLTETNTLETTGVLLKDKISKLEAFIENNMEINISNSTNNPIMIKYNSPVIIIVYSHTSHTHVDNRKYSILGNNNYHTDFKLIKCNLLIIDLVISPGYKDNGLNLENIKYIPLAVSKLIIKNGNKMYSNSNSRFHWFKNDYINDFLKKIDPNTAIQMIEFNSCNIDNIYSSILHLKLLKTIIIKNCPEFSESDIFKQNGYIVELS
jgi:hypothetical protein